MESGKICTGQIILQPISLKSDRLLEFQLFTALVKVRHPASLRVFTAIKPLANTSKIPTAAIAFGTLAQIK